MCLNSDDSSKADYEDDFKKLPNCYGSPTAQQTTDKNQICAQASTTHNDGTLLAFA